MRTNIFWGIIIFTLVIIGISVFAYVQNFANGFWHFSNDTSKWSNFSNYLNVFVAIGNLILIFTLTYNVFLFDKKYKEISERPVLIIRELPHSDTWSIKNVGKGVAMNIHVALSTSNQNVWKQPVKCYSLASGDGLDLPWIKNAHSIAISYKDIFNNTNYSSVCVGDETTIEIDKDILKEIKGNSLRLAQAMRNANEERFVW